MAVQTTFVNVECVPSFFTEHQQQVAWDEHEAAHVSPFDPLQALLSERDEMVGCRRQSYFQPIRSIDSNGMFAKKEGFWGGIPRLIIKFLGRWGSSPVDHYVGNSAEL
eukprot:2646990-Amphidinium_carterae.1